jgi:hypothetical protein
LTAVQLGRVTQAALAALWPSVEAEEVPPRHGQLYGAHAPQIPDCARIKTLLVSPVLPILDRARQERPRAGRGAARGNPSRDPPKRVCSHYDNYCCLVLGFAFSGSSMIELLGTKDFRAFLHESTHRTSAALLRGRKALDHRARLWAEFEANNARTRDVLQRLACLLAKLKVDREESHLSHPLRAVVVLTPTY